MRQRVTFVSFSDRQMRVDFNHMKLYKLVVESWGETLSEDLYVNKDNVLKDALEYMDRRPYMVERIDSNNVTVKESEWGVHFYTPDGTQLSDVYIDVVETID